ncbi:hypothetical protein [Actinomadura vinacea]
MRVIHPGAPLDLGTLDPSRTYLWLVDAKGDFRLAPEQDPSYVSLYPRRIHPAGSGRIDHGLKHADLAAGGWNGWLPKMLRPPARMGGELWAEKDSCERPTGQWIMNNNSAYNARRTRLDRRYRGKKHLCIAHELLLRASGLDTSSILIEEFKPDLAIKSPSSDSSAHKLSPLSSNYPPS